MIAYYDITKAMHDHLIADPEVNSVELRGIDDIDTSKQEIFALAHVGIQNAEFNEGMVRFTITVSVMDIVDDTRTDIRDVDASERWKGIDNRQDILNTTLAVIERLVRSIKKGTLYSGAYELVTHTAEPFEERFENLLTGWTATLTLDIPNAVQEC
jgi:hypothetical protein